MEYFDNHAHYNDERFDEDRANLIEDMKKCGVTKIISAGYNIVGSKWGIEIANTYDFIYTTVGISPNDIEPNYLEDIDQLEGLLKTSNKILAIGEIGLDYHYDTNREWQKDAFIKQIEIANRNKLPIVIHTRDAVMDTISILKEHQVEKKGVFHCCPFNRELVKEALNLGYYISFSGTVTFKNSKNAEEIVNMVPLEKMLIETDSPYLAPEPVRGTRNDSRNLKYIVQKIAEYKGYKEEEIAQATYENAKRVYEIEE